MRFSPLGIPTSAFLLLAVAGCTPDEGGDDFGSNDAADQSDSGTPGDGTTGDEGSGGGDEGGSGGGGSEGGDAGEADDGSDDAGEGEDASDDDAGDDADTGEDGESEDAGDSGDDAEDSGDADDSGDDDADDSGDDSGEEEGDSSEDSGGEEDDSDDSGEDDSGGESEEGDSGEDDSGDDSGEDDSGEDDGGDGSDGCGMDHDTGTLEMTVNIGGTDREYLLIVPSSYDENTAYPLIFGMHGLGGNGPLLRQYMSIESLTAGNAIHVYPSSNGSSWDLSQSGVDVQFFDAIVEYAETNLCIDSDRIFSYGHSYGGFYSNALGCYRGDVLRAIGPVAGGGPNGSCQGQVAAILMHGTDDGTVNISSGRGSRDHWVSANGCSNSTMDIEPAPCVEYTGCDSEYPVVWCEHTGINHNVPWSGQLNYGPEALWDFFQRF